MRAFPNIALSKLFQKEKGLRKVHCQCVCRIVERRIARFASKVCALLDIHIRSEADDHLENLKRRYHKRNPLWELN